MTAKTCLNCQGEFDVQPKRRDTAKYCSVGCHVGHKQVAIKCEYCSEDIIRAQSKSRQGQKHQFCNRDHHNAYQREQGNGYIVEGYVRLTRNGHPLAERNSKGYLLEHWLTMYDENPDFTLWAQEKNWTIHHKNGKRDDNRLGNLEWRAPGHHPVGWGIEEMIKCIERFGYRVTSV